MPQLTKITPVLLCGGYGTRLWPLSRRSYPKQFLPLLGDRTLLQKTALRSRGAGPGYGFEPPLVLTHADFRFIVTEQLMAVGIDPGAVLLEPEGRNTAPAILAASLHAAARDPEAVLLVLPSDQEMPDAAAFRAAVGRGLEAVAQGRLVTFGITPDHPSTAYGYLELPEEGAADPAPATDPRPLAGFVEKPDAARAAAMLASGRHLWNGGIFLFRAGDMVTAFRRHLPGMVAPVQQALEQARPDLGFLRLDPAAWQGCEAISIDHGVMEKAGNLSVVPFAGDWSDLGSWAAIRNAAERDAGGNATVGEVTAIDCRDSLFYSASDQIQMVGIGVENLVAVATNDAILIASSDRVEDVKLAVAKLVEKGAHQAEHFPRVHRPWGWYDSLLVGNRFQLKRIVVRPGGTLSLQSHLHRSEHWIVVEGTARVTLGNEVRLLSENESIYIPIGSRHRLENPGKIPVVLIEVQTGAYIGEDDIQRYEDLYART